MKHPYYDTINLIERLHRIFLDVLKIELDRMGIQDINNVQSLILYNIGEEEMTIGELTARGYYLGSNVSYNVKKMVENDYLTQERCRHDRRSVRVRLTRKGLELHDRIAGVFEAQLDRLDMASVSDEELVSINKALVKLERFWSGHISWAGLNMHDAA